MQILSASIIVALILASPIFIGLSTAIIQSIYNKKWNKIKKITKNGQNTYVSEFNNTFVVSIFLSFIPPLFYRLFLLFLSYPQFISSYVDILYGLSNTGVILIVSFFMWKSAFREIRKQRRSHDWH